MNRIKSMAKKLIVGVIALYVLWLGFKWTAMRAFVGPDEALIVTNKFGDPLPAGYVVVPAENNRYKGVQEEVRGPGRYFLDPVEYEWQVVPQVHVPAGDPDRWGWDADGNLKDPGTAPQVAVISLKDR